MNKFAKHPEKYPIEFRYAKLRKELRFLLKTFGVIYDSKDYDVISKAKEKSLIISNHLSLADPMIYICLSEKPITFVAKKEVFKYPFVGKCAKAIDVFPLDRHNLMKQIGEIKNVVSYLKDKSKPNVLIFIEGTRNKNPENECLEFHAGTLKIAQMAGCPLILSSIFGTFRILDKHCHLKNYPARINVIREIDVDEVKKMNTTEYAISLKKEVDNEVDIMRAFDKKFILNSKLSDERKQLEISVDARANS